MSGSTIRVIIAVLLLIVYFVFRFQYNRTGDEMFNKLRYITAAAIVILAIVTLVSGR